MPALLTVGVIEGLRMLTNSPQILSKLNENIRHFHKGIKRIVHPLLEFQSAVESPLIHLKFKEVQRRDYAEEERYLQGIVDKGVKAGLLLTVARYVEPQDKSKPSPSIRICLSSGFTSEDIEKILKKIQEVIE
jgi:serine palmitoyltransferase